MHYPVIPAPGGRDALPQKMWEQQQWVNWRYEKRQHSRTTKVPLSPHTGRHASSSNPQTWGSFDEAMARVRSRCGLGFVLTPPFIGVDLDHCVTDDGTLNRLAAQILAYFNGTYAEWSPSGQGVHLFLLGDLPRSFKTPLGEIYTTSRFFTVTGQALPNASLVLRTAQHTDLVWLAQQITPRQGEPRPQRTHATGSDGRRAVRSSRGSEALPCELATEGTVSLDINDTAPVAPVLFNTLCHTEPLWLPTWKKTRKLRGPAGDQSDSAYEMSLARLAVMAGVDDQDIYKLLLQWRVEHQLPPKHLKGILLTIQNAHNDAARQAEEDLMEHAETLDGATKAQLASRLLGLPIVRLVQLGRANARYYAQLVDGTTLNLLDFYGAFAWPEGYKLWQRLVYEHAHTVLDMDRRRWRKVASLLMALCEYEESLDVSDAAETQGWVDNYFSDTTLRACDNEVLRRGAAFWDDTGQYLFLDNLRKHVNTHCGVRVSRGELVSRLTALGWKEIALSSREHPALTRIYWHFSV